MKNETLEQEVQLLKNDINNIMKCFRTDLNNIIKELHFEKEKYEQYVKHIYEIMEIKLPKKRNCMACDGKGNFYVPTTCDFSPICTECDGKGYLWK